MAQLFLRKQTYIRTGTGVVRKGGQPLKRVSSVVLFTLIILLLSACGVAAQQSFTVKVGDNAYEVSGQPERQEYFHAVVTPKGILWNSVPPMEGQSLYAHPIRPFTLYLSPLASSKLDTNRAQKIITLPLQTDYLGDKLNVFPGSMFNSGDWLVYDIYLKSPGMNQASISKLYALGLTNKKNVLITDFHVGGGNQFILGMDGYTLLLDKQIPNNLNGYDHHISVYNLETERLTEVFYNEIKIQDDTYIYNGHVFKMISL